MGAGFVADSHRGPGPVEARRALRVLLVASALAVLALLSSSTAAASTGASGPRAQVARLGSAPRAQRLQLVLPLKADIAGLERFASAVTSFGSPLYGDFQPIATLARRFGALASERSRVLDYLRGHGAARARIDATGLFADVSMTVSQTQRLFGTALSRYESTRQGRYLAPSRPVRLPGALAGAVTGVVGLDTQPVFATPPAVMGQSAPGAPSGDGQRAATASAPSGYSERTGTASGCPAALADHGFTPNQYLTAYDLASLQASGVQGQGERVALIEIDGFRYSDVRTFARCFGLRVPVINGYGVNLKHPLAPGGETTLDLEVLDTAAPGLKEVDVYESRARAADVLESLTAPLQNRGHVPDVISASLGTCEPALKPSLGSAGERSVEGALAMAAASGISILASSGDGGSSACIGRNGPIDVLAVSYPASSPYVTGIGGTNVTLTPANQIEAQYVWNDAPYDLSAGGGGLSTVFKRPSYQHGFVPQNRRAVPDVSLLADVLPGYNIYCTAPECLAGNPSPWITVGGTSASAPLLAGGLTLVDQLLREHGRQNLGLANPLLYEIDSHYASSGVISDVTINNNDLGSYIPAGNHRPLGCCSAELGFDLASGLGSVDLGRLALVASALQPPISTVALNLPGSRKAPGSRSRASGRWRAIACRPRSTAPAAASSRPAPRSRSPVPAGSGSAQSPSCSATEGQPR